MKEVKAEVGGRSGWVVSCKFPQELHNLLQRTVSNAAHRATSKANRRLHLQLMYASEDILRARIFCGFLMLSTTTYYLSGCIGACV